MARLMNEVIVHCNFMLDGVESSRTAGDNGNLKRNHRNPENSLLKTGKVTDGIPDKVCIDVVTRRMCGVAKCRVKICFGSVKGDGNSHTRNVELCMDA
jgi:hypothetical protein